MSRQAWFYLWLGLGIGAVSLGAIFAELTLDDSQWWALAGLTLFAVGFQILEAEAASWESDHSYLVFLAAGVLLLSPVLFPLLVLIPHLLEWAKQGKADSLLRPQGYRQPLKAVSHILAGVAAYGVHLFATSWGDFASPPLSIIEVGATVVTYVLSHHLLIGQVLVQTRRASWHTSKVLTFDRLLTDFILMVVGYVMVLLYQVDGWLLLPAMALLGLVFKVLKVPQLEKAAQTDAKTGLLNAGHWHRRLREETERAHFFKHSLALILVDLDGLRTINNTYGHLAGDVVIAGIAQPLQRNVRGYDIVGRFGGEEVAVALPEAVLE